MSDGSQAAPPLESRAASLGLDFYRLVEGASDLILIVRDGKIVYANPALARTLGYAPAELLGRPPADIVHPDERAVSRARVEQALREGAAPLVERRLRCRDGSMVTIEGSAFATTFEGSPAVVLMGRDLTDRKRAEEERRRSQADFRAMVDAMPGLVAVHAEGRFLYVNATLATLFGYSQEEVVGRSVLEFVPEHNRAEAIERLAGRPMEGMFERDFLRRDGTRRLLTLATIMCTFEGRTARLTVGYDSTDRVKAEERLRALFASSPLGIVTLDEDGTPAHWNRKAEEMLGWPAASPRARADFSAQLKRVVTGLCERARLHGHGELEAPIQDGASGRPVVLRAAVAPLRLMLTGAPAGFVLMLSDVTEARQAREALRAVFDASPQAIVATDRDGIVNMWSDAAEWILGWNAGEMLGKRAPFIEEADGPVSGTMRRALSGEPAHVETRVRKRSGEVDVSISFGPLRGAGGEVIGCVAVVADISRRRRLEEEAAASNAALQRAAVEWQTTFDTVDAAIAVLDAATGEVVRLNRAAQALLGGTSAQRPLRELVSSEPWRTAAELLPRVHRTRTPALEQARQDRKVWLVSLSPVDSWPGSGAAVIVLARDVTPLVELQDSLRRSEAMSAMGSLVAGVAHEVRNPLFGISATLDAMGSRLGPVPGAEPFLEMLRRELDRLNTLMRDLLDYGRPPEAQLSREPLAPVIAAALRACAASAQQRNIQVDNAVGADAGEVRMDAARIAQVFQNLVENAIQHSSPGGHVRIEASSGVLAGSPSVEVRVLDRGHGFRLDDLPRLFEPFFTRRRGGTGLGLSIVQRITEQHGGVVEVGNRPEGGAVVTVRLPREPPFTPATG